MIEVNTPYKVGAKTLWLAIPEKGIYAIYMLILLVVMAILFAIGPSISQSDFHLSLAQYVGIDNVMSLITLVLIFIFVVVAVYAVLFSYLEYTNYTFTLESHALEIKKGIFSRYHISIPYKEIQDVDVNQSLIQRMFGISHVIILSSGQKRENEEHGDHSEYVFVHMEKQRAQDLHEKLTERLNFPQLKNEKQDAASA